MFSFWCFTTSKFPNFVAIVGTYNKNASPIWTIGILLFYTYWFVDWLIFRRTLLAERVETLIDSATEVKEKLVLYCHPDRILDNAWAFPISSRCFCTGPGINTDITSQQGATFLDGPAVSKERNTRQYEKCELDKPNPNAFHKVVRVWASSALTKEVPHPPRPTGTWLCFDDAPRQWEKLRLETIASEMEAKAAGPSLSLCNHNNWRRVWPKWWIYN